MKWYYISHPYTGDEAANRAEAAKIQRDLQGRHTGILFLNPLEMFAALETMAYDAVMELCLAMLRKSDAIVMSGAHEESRGCCRELQEAVKAGLPVLYYIGSGEALRVAQERKLSPKE